MSVLSAEQQVEQLAAQLHDVYIEEAKRQGDVRHKEDYFELTEKLKDFDRALARFILKREADLTQRLEASEQHEINLNRVIDIEKRRAIAAERQLVELREPMVCGHVKACFQEQKREILPSDGGVALEGVKVTGICTACAREKAQIASAEARGRLEEHKECCINCRDGYDFGCKRRASLEKQKAEKKGE